MGWNKNTLIPRRETAKAAPKVSNWYSFHLIGLGNVYWTFCFSGGNPPFWKLENALSLKGTLQNRTQWGPFDSLSILLGLGNVYWTSRFRGGNLPFEILKIFYPQEGLCGAEPEGGSNVFTFHFIGVGKGTGGFKIWNRKPPFWNVKNVLSSGETLRSGARSWSNCFYFPFYWSRKGY